MNVIRTKKRCISENINNNLLSSCWFILSNWSGCSCSSCSCRFGCSSRICGCFLFPSSLFFLLRLFSPPPLLLFSGSLFFFPPLFRRVFLIASFLSFPLLVIPTPLSSSSFWTFLGAPFLRGSTYSFLRSFF